MRSMSITQNELRQHPIWVRFLNKARGRSAFDPHLYSQARKMTSTTPNTQNSAMTDLSFQGLVFPPHWRGRSSAQTNPRQIMVPIQSRRSHRWNGVWSKFSGALRAVYLAVMNHAITATDKAPIGTSERPVSAFSKRT